MVQQPFFLPKSYLFVPGLIIISEREVVVVVGWCTVLNESFFILSKKEVWTVVWNCMNVMKLYYNTGGKKLEKSW